jgi:hypothetical protein
MTTYEAKIKKTLPNGKNLIVRLNAQTIDDAKMILQAIYGFHAITHGPIEKRLTNEEIQSVSDPDKQKIDNLRNAKKRADAALSQERDKQKKTHALATLNNLAQKNEVPKHLTFR